MRIFLMIAGLLTMVSAAMADDMPKAKHLVARYVATDPIPWSRFCTKYRSECDTPSDSRYAVMLNHSTLEIIKRINKLVNDDILYVTDNEHWHVEDQYDLPTDGKGDCEDIALQKRHLLIKAGLPARALLLTVVIWRGDGHAVLTVVTDHGDFLLDNHTNKIMTFDDLSYKLIQRQDPNWLSQWKRFDEWRP